MKNFNLEQTGRKFVGFVKDEIVFSVALILTIISMFIVPPSAVYAGYINYSVLALLFCLMSVVQGLKKQGVFDVISAVILSKTKKLRNIGILLMSMCFFSAMFVTNDVALITFVPLTFILFEGCGKEDELIFIIVMETIAANLGSMVTPIGNPQNLYLYYHYGIEVGEFFSIVLPYGILSFILIFAVMYIRLKKDMLNVEIRLQQIRSKRELVKYLLLFVLCLLTVFEVIEFWVCLGVTIIVLLLTDHKVLCEVDYMLLLTFVCFFIFVGNLGEVEAVRSFVENVIEGRTLIFAVLLSQVISNVPAAAMLSGFTQDYRSLLIGVDIGGLGTLVASLASLISYKFYAKARPALSARYIKVFVIYNIVFLIVLLLMAMCVL